MRRFRNRLRAFDPDQLQQLSRLGLYARTVVEGFVAGMHRSNALGYNVEFADFREYVPGDDLRMLDWKVYARSDRFYIRRYEEETSLRAWIVVDCSASMGYGEPTSKLDTAAHLAAALAYLLVRQQDDVGLCTFGEELHTHHAPAASPVQLRQLWETLEGLRAEGRSRLYAALEALAGRMTRRGLVIVISDLLVDVDELARGIALFTHRKFDAIVLQVLTPAELDFPFRGDYRFEDTESRDAVTVRARTMREDYLASLEAHLLALRGACARVRAAYHLHRTDATPEVTLAAFLAARR